MVCEAKAMRRAFVQVWVKVSEIRDEGGGPPKINCSMKLVSQDDGTDLDPDNTKGAKRGRPGFQGPMTDAPPEASPCKSRETALHVMHLCLGLLLLPPSV